MSCERSLKLRTAMVGFRTGNAEVTTAFVEVTTAFVVFTTAIVVLKGELFAIETATLHRQTQIAMIET